MRGWTRVCWPCLVRKTGGECKTIGGVPLEKTCAICGTALEQSERKQFPIQPDTFFADDRRPTLHVVRGGAR